MNLFRSLMWDWGWIRRKRAYEIIDATQDRADVLQRALADCQEELRQERADRLIKTENEKTRRSEAAKRAWETRRSA